MTAHGWHALSANTTGSNNTADGSSALASNTSGWSNTAVGAYSLQNNTTGGNNVAVGDSALYSNLGGTWNVAVGTTALMNNTTGWSNIAVGDGLTAKTVHRRRYVRWSVHRTVGGSGSGAGRGECNDSQGQRVRPGGRHRPAPPNLLQRIAKSFDWLKLPAAIPADITSVDRRQKAWFLPAAP